MRSTSVASLLVAIAAVGVVVVACSSDDDDDWAYDGPRSECSTGPARDGEQFPQLDSSYESAGKLPECIARCGATTIASDGNGTVWPVAALPSGACSHDGEVCSMAAVRTLDCPDGRTATCSLTEYACRCEDGSWRCYSGPQGASACICSLPDAGSSDAARD